MKFISKTILVIIICVQNHNYSFAQIIYTDIDPDTTIIVPLNSGRNLGLDINKDGENDYVIKVDNLSTLVRNVQIQGDKIPNLVAGDGDTNNIEDFFPMAFENGDSIKDNPSLIWHNDWEYNWDHPLAFTICGYGISGPGHWAGGSDGMYVGLKMKYNGNWHYGWIGIDIPDSANTCTIRDYAFENTPGKTILAGETATSVIENHSESKIPFNVYTQDSKIYISINDKDFENGIIKVFNVVGKEAISVNTCNLHSVFSIDNLTYGTYIIRLVNNTAIWTHKIILR